MDYICAKFDYYCSFDKKVTEEKVESARNYGAPENRCGNKVKYTYFEEYLRTVASVNGFKGYAKKLHQRYRILNMEIMKENI